MINNHVPINFKLKTELTEGEEEIRSNDLSAILYACLVGNNIVYLQ